jgi:hypothetical protein
VVEKEVRLREKRARREERVRERKCECEEVSGSEGVNE